MMPTGDTIFAPATASGRAGVAIIRLSGPDCLKGLSALGIHRLLPARQAFYCQLSDSRNNETIDQAVVIHFPAPASFTGEDVVELHLHGSRAVIRVVLERLSEVPKLRMAEPGEFSRRAFFNGKMDLTEIEGLADLIDAETSEQRKQALTALSGEQGNRFEALREKLVKALAHLEATIDFSDEDIPDSLLKQVDDEVTMIRTTIAEALAYRQPAERIREGVSVVLLGAPNVGKSSLLNALASRDAAIVSTQAGTTRDIIEVHVDIGGYPVVLVDTAGIRESNDEIEQEGIARARARASKADLRIVLFDAEQLPELDPTSASLLESYNSIAVLNKTDEAMVDLPSLIKSHQTLALSAKTGQGIEQLFSKILDNLQRLSDERPVAGSHSLIISRTRHRQALELANSHLERFSIHSPIEISCEELRRAAVEIGKITGKISVDELLDRIFSEFCIGK